MTRLGVDQRVGRRGSRLFALDAEFQARTGRDETMSAALVPESARAGRGCRAFLLQAGLNSGPAGAGCWFAEGWKHWGWPAKPGRIWFG